MRAWERPWECEKWSEREVPGGIHIYVTNSLMDDWILGNTSLAFLDGYSMPYFLTCQLISRYWSPLWFNMLY